MMQKESSLLCTPGYIKHNEKFRNTPFSSAQRAVGACALYARFVVVIRLAL